VLYGSKVRNYLRDNCIKVDGVPDWRIVDPDTQYTDQNHRFVKALKRPRTSLPWLIISNGVTGYEGPFPGGPDATLSLIQSFAGQQPTPAPQPSIATVLVVSADNCLWCDKWDSMERGGVESLPGVVIETTKTVPPGVSKTPSFVLTKNGRTKILSGYQTSATIAQELAAL